MLEVLEKKYRRCQCERLRRSSGKPQSGQQEEDIQEYGWKRGIEDSGKCKGLQDNEIFPSLGHSIPNAGVLWFEHKHYFNSVGMELLLKLIMHLSIV